MSGGEHNHTTAALSRELILKALQALSDELGRRNVTGELCLVEGLFAEGKV